MGDLLKVLVIPDAHIHQDSNLERFDKLGNYIAKEKPEVIISMGDFVSMQSISHWDAHKKLTMEGRRYRLDMNKGKEALSKLFSPLYAIQRRQKELKEKQYRPRVIYLEGNHEAWVDKYLEENPSMEGQIGIDLDLGLAEKGIEFVPYKSYVTIEDVQFTHMPISGSGQAVSGADICSKVARYVAKSTVFAHTHRLEHSVVTRVGAEPMQLLTVGCFFNGEDDEPFGLNRWRGIVMLDIYSPGKFDMQTVSMESLYEKY